MMRSAIRRSSANVILMLVAGPGSQRTSRSLNRSTQLAVSLPLNPWVAAIW
jgi:hypothetical protein